jgi:transposase
MKEGLLGGTLSVSLRSELEEARLHVARWIGSSRNQLDVCLLSEHCEVLEQFAAPSDLDGLRGLVRRVGGYGLPVRGVIESMTGARFVHDTLERLAWEVLIADAQKVKGLAPLTCKTDRIDARVLAVLSHRDLVPAIWLPDPGVRAERE